MVYFAGYKNHIGFYALPSGNDAFQKELSNYKTGKGSIQFPLSEELPWQLIEKIVKYISRPISDIDLPELPDFLKPKPSTPRPQKPIQDIDLPEGASVIQPDESVEIGKLNL